MGKPEYIIFTFNKGLINDFSGKGVSVCKHTQTNERMNEQTDLEVEIVNRY